MHKSYILLLMYLLVHCSVCNCQDEHELHEFKAELPPMDSNATSRYWTAAPTEFDHCSLNHQASPCDVQFTASQDQCQGKLSFNSLLLHFFPNDIFASVLNYFIIPEKFDVTRFYINTCKGQLEFFAVAREDIDLIPNRLRVSDAVLSLRVMYRVTSLYYAIVSFEMTGYVQIENRKFELKAIKSYGNEPMSINIKVNQISAKNFATLFSVTEFTSEDLPSTIEEIISVSLSSIVIEGSYHIEGCFEFLLKGKPDMTNIFQKSDLYILITKQCDNKVTAGLVVDFQSADLKQILVDVLGRDVPFRIPILWFEKYRIILQSSISGIAKVKNENFNQAFRFFVTRGMAVNTGLTLSIEFPMQEYGKKVTPVIPELQLPIKCLFIVKPYKNRIEVHFETEFSLSLDKTLLIFMSTSKAVSMTNTFKRVDTPVKVDMMELRISSQTVVVYMNVMKRFSMVQGLVPIPSLQIRLQRTATTGWQIFGDGDANIAETPFKTKIKQGTDGIYTFLGKTDKLSSYKIIEFFAKDSGMLELVNSLQFLQFDILDVLTSSKVGGDLHFRITGRPQIFDYDAAQYCEGVVYNNTNIRPGFALGIVLKNIEFDELVVKIFGSREQRGTWLVNVDCAILISTDNENEGSKKISFNLTELNELPLKRGISMLLRIYLPGDCRGDGLCNLLDTALKAKGNILLKGDLGTSELLLEWRTDSLMITQNVYLRDVVFSIRGGKTITLMLLGRIDVYGISMQGSITSDVSSGVLIDMTMDGNSNAPFNLNGVSIGDVSYKESIQTDANITTLELNGKVYFGTVPIAGRLTAELFLTININDFSKSYFYSKIGSLQLTELLEAFEIKAKIPLALQQLQFTEPIIASYSNDPLGTSLQHLNLHIQNEFTIQGIVAVLGFYGEYTINFKSQNLIIKIDMPKVYFAKGLVKLYTATGQPIKQKYNGPQLIAEISTAFTTIRLEGLAKVLGVSTNVNISISDTGYNFTFSGSILGVFYAEIHARSAFMNPSDAAFKITSCIPTALPNVTHEIVQLLQFINQSTKKFLESTKNRINQMETIFKQSHKRLAIHKERTEFYKKSIKKGIRSLNKLKNQNVATCPNDCSDVCIGGPGWKEDALAFGQYRVGSPGWLKCIKETPDVVCVVRCLGRSVIRYVKAFNKQNSLQKMLSAYQESQKKQKFSSDFLQKAIYKVGAIINKLESANNELNVGLDVAKAVSGSKIVEIVNIDSICMQGSIEEAVDSKVVFKVDGTIAKHQILKLEVRASIDSKLWKNIAMAISEEVFKNSTSFNQKLATAKSSLNEIDKDKIGLLQEMKQSLVKNDIGEASKKDVIDLETGSDEMEFKKISYMELPRYTLSNDGIIQYFSKLSPWKIIANTDPLENAFLTNSTKRTIPSGQDSTDTGEISTKSCSRVHKTVKKYQDIFHVASGVAENFFEEKISFLKTKNRLLAELRDIEDQIKSDCYLENCTTGELRDALKYSEKAKAGIVDWVREVKHQIGKHDRAGLQILSENIGYIVEKEENVNLKSYLQSLSDSLVKNYKRGNVIGLKTRKMVTLLEQMDLDVRDILLNGREKRISEAAPVIFTMKNRFKRLGHILVKDCKKRSDNILTELLDKN